MPMPPELIVLLDRHIRSLEGGLGGHGAQALLFPSKRGTDRFVGSTNKKLREMCELAGIEKHITTHCFRYSLNNLVRRTAGEVVARSMLGHVTSEMTHRYSHVDLAEKADAQRRALGVLPDPTSVRAAVGGPVGMAGGDEAISVGIAAPTRKAG